MEELFNRPWFMGVILAIFLACMLELGRRVAGWMHVDLAP